MGLANHHAGDSMQRAIWKGAINFGLVHVPVALYPASQETGIDFDWLDKRSMDPVGYKRVNKRTGKEVASDQIVKGIKQDDGDYVVLSEEQIRAAYPKATQTIEIDSFVEAAQIPFVLLERPYFLEPVGKSERVYVLLREAMRAAGVIGIARVVMHTKEHLAALIPSGQALMLNTIRWASEMRSGDELKLPADGKSAISLKPEELRMAKQLIGDMTHPWKADEHADTFTAAVHALVNRKLKAGDTEKVTPLDEAPSTSGSNVVDLTQLLAQSLASRKSGAASKPAAKSAAVKKKAVRRPAAKRA
jgi:DNA end-binding protein Ku